MSSMDEFNWFATLFFTLAACSENLDLNCNVSLISWIFVLLTNVINSSAGQQTGEFSWTVRKFLISDYLKEIPPVIWKYHFMALHFMAKPGKDYFIEKFENNKLSMCLLWRQIEPVHNVQKLAKRGVPYSLLSLSAIYLYFVNHCHSHRMSIYREKWNYFQFVTEQERSHSNCQNFLSKKYCP